MNSLTKSVTWILGIVLVLIGVAGFFTNGMLLVFQVDTVHNIVHLLSGVVGIAAAASGDKYSRLYLIGFGLVYGLVTIVGFVNGGDILGLFTVNDADNYLHAAIAVVSLGVGFGSKKCCRTSSGVARAKPDTPWNQTAAREWAAVFMPGETGRPMAAPFLPCSVSLRRLPGVFVLRLGGEFAIVDEGVDDRRHVRLQEDEKLRMLPLAEINLRPHEHRREFRRIVLFPLRGLRHEFAESFDGNKDDLLETREQFLRGGKRKAVGHARFSCEPVCRECGSHRGLRRPQASGDA